MSDEEDLNFHDIMDPAPGQKYVEFSKDGGDGDSKKEKADAGLDVEKKKGHGDRIYFCRVEHPAPTHNLNVGDRLVALNGKAVEKFSGDVEAIHKEFRSNNVVKLLVDPTMLK